MASKTKVNLRNDSGGSITFGSLTINPTQSVVIWDTDSSEVTAVDNFVQVRDNIATFNENISNGNLVYVIGAVDQSSLVAYSHFNSLVNSYPLIYSQTEFQLEGITSDVPISNQHGGIIYHGQDKFKRLGPGNAGEVLMSQGSGADVVWSNLDGYVLSGPITSTDGALALFDGIDGDRIKESGITVDGYDNIQNINAASFVEEGDYGNSGDGYITIDFSTLGQKAKVILTGDVGIYFSFPGVGNYLLKLVQDATGFRDVTVDTNVRATDGQLDLSGAANSETIWSIYYDGTNSYISSLPNAQGSVTINLY